MKLVCFRTPKSKGYMRLILTEGEEKFDLHISEHAYRSLGEPRIGDEIEDTEALLFYDMQYRARLTALRILSYGDSSESGLVRKLLSRKISLDIARECAREMVSLGYINESRQLERLIVEDSNRKLLGPRKIVPRLLSRGYALADIKEAFEALTSSGEIDMNENKERLLEKYLGGDRDPEQVRRLLFKYGYDF